MKHDVGASRAGQEKAQDLIARKRVPPLDMSENETRALTGSYRSRESKPTETVITCESVRKHQIEKNGLQSRRGALGESVGAANVCRPRAVGGEKS